MADMDVTAKFRADISDMQAKLTVLDRQIRGLGDAADAASRSMGTKIADAGQKMTSVGKNLTVGLTLPLVGIGVAAVKTQKDFDVAMKSMQVNSGASADDMIRLSDLAKQMGADTVFSAGEAADAMLELSKGGLSIANIEGGALAATMNLAATEGINLAEAGTIVVNAMNQFGIAAGNSADIADTLAAGAVASTAGVQDLAGGLKYVGTTANQLGYSLGDTTTALAAMNNAGIDSTTAGTSLNRFMMGLIGLTPKARDRMKELGLSFKGSNGELLPMTDVLRILEERLGNLSAPARAQALNDIFRVEGARAANALIELGADNFAKLGEEVDKAGVAADLANARMSGVAGALEQLRGSLETAALEIGETLAPYIMRFADTIKTLADRFLALPANIQASIIGFAGIAAAAGPALIVAGQLAVAYGRLANVLSDVIPRAASAAAGAIKSVSLAFLTNPIVLVIAGIVAAIAGLVIAFKAVYDRSAELRAAVGRLVETLRSIVTVITTQILGAFRSLTGQQDKAQKSSKSLGEIFNDVARIAGRILVPVVDFLAGAFEVVGNAVRLLIKYWEVLATIIKMLANVIRVVLIAVVNNLIEQFNGLMRLLGPIGAAIQNLASRIANAFRNVPEIVRSAVQNSVGFLQDLINTAIDGINFLIRAYNMIPGVGKVAEIGAFQFANFSNTVKSTGRAIAYSDSAAMDYFRTSERTFASQQKLNGAVAEGAGNFQELGEETEGASGKTDKLKQKYDELKNKINELKDTYMGYRDSVRDSIMGQLSLGQAFDDYTERQKKVTDTLNALTEYRSQIEGEATEAQKQRLLELQTAYQDAQTAAAKGAQSIVDEFVAQGERIRDFNTNLNKLLQAGLSQRAFDAIVREGYKRGGDIAAALVEGNIQENARRVNEVYNSVETMATQTGDRAAAAYFGVGTKLALQTLEGMVKEFLPSGKKRRELLDLIKSLNDSIKFEPKYLDIITRYSTQGSPAAVTSVSGGGGGGNGGGGGGGGFSTAEQYAMGAVGGGGGTVNFAGAAATAAVASQFSAATLANAQALNAAAAAGKDVTKLGFTKSDWADLAKLEAANIAALATGGIVTGPTLSLIGEAGPEAVIPLSGRNMPNMGGTTINITVNAGIGTNGSEVGREIVDALRQYERRNGPLPVKVAS